MATTAWASGLCSLARPSESAAVHRPPPSRTWLAAAVAVLVGLLCASCGAPAVEGPPGERASPNPARTSKPTSTPAAAARTTQRSGWLASWAAPPVTAIADAADRPRVTVRNLVHLSVGGDQVRVRLSNAFGTSALTIDHAAVAIAARTASAESVAGTTRTVRFDRGRSTIVPAGSDTTSDPVGLSVRAGSTLQVSTYLEDPHGPLTAHPIALQSSFLAIGDRVGTISGAAFTATTAAWHLVTEVAVHATPPGGTVVAFGDSITEGAGSTAGANNRWPDVLGRRLAAGHRGVVSAGIGGNRLLRDSPPGTAGSFGPAGLARFNRDVLGRTGVRTVIVLEGVNDLQLDPSNATVAALVGGLGQLVERAHAARVRVVCGTILPFGRWTSWNPAKESVRAGVNARIRAGRCDATVDFDRLLRDPTEPRRLAAEYDSGDGLHPSDAGHRRMGEAIPVSVL